MGRNLVVAFLFALLLTGCSTKTTEENGSFPAVVIWNNNIYYGSIETVSEQEIGIEIGKVEKEVGSFPKNNLECNYAPAGSKLYEIEGTDKQKVIAIKLENEYRKAFIEDIVIRK
jgi:hypothetical protein